MSIVDFDTCTWADPWFMNLNPSGKLLFIYLWTNSKKTLSGIYSISQKTIAFETELNKKQVTDTLSILYPKVIYDFECEIVFVKNHVKRQFLRTGKISPKVVSGISTSLHLLPQGHEFIGLFLEAYPELQIEYLYPIDTLSEGYVYPPSGGEGTGKGTGSTKANVKFQPPTIDEVREYCKERGNGIDPETFVDHYTANGWLVGKNKMKDWKAALRNWVRRKTEGNNQNQDGRRPASHTVSCSYCGRDFYNDGHAKDCPRIEAVQ